MVADMRCATVILATMPVHGDPILAAIFLALVVSAAVIITRNAMSDITEE
jgi:hypothetical protein